MGAMTTTLPPSIPPRLVEHTDAPARRPLGWRPPAQTLRGALAGAEAAIGSWLVVAVVAIAGYVVTAATPELGSAGWIDAAAVGSAIWLLGHGGTLDLAGASITLIPVGVTLLGVAGTAASMRRVPAETWWPVGAAVLAYTVLAGGFAALAGTPGSWRGVLGAPVVASIGCLVALRGRYPDPVAGWLARIPDGVRLGCSAGARAAAVILAMGLLAVVGALALGFSRVLEIHESLVPDGASTVIMIVAQVLLLPTLVVWASAFLVGPGFAVGTGTLFSPTGIDAGPLPVVPVLGALPEPASVAGSIGFVVLLGVLTGALAGWWLRRRALSLPGTAIAVGVAAATAALALGVLAALSSGAVGPGRMAEVGPDAAAVGVAVLWQVLLGAALAGLLLHPTSRAFAATARDTARRWYAGVRGRQD